MQNSNTLRSHLGGSGTREDRAFLLKKQRPASTLGALAATASGLLRVQVLAAPAVWLGPLHCFAVLASVVSSLASDCI